MHCKDGSIIPFTETEDIFINLDHIMADDWELVDGSSIQALTINTFAFGEALSRLKRGKKVTRKGWNGKEYFQFVCLIPHSNNMHRGFPMQDCLGLKDEQNKMQPGWIPSISDLLAEDWFEMQ